jgi:hypothetical protein
MRLQSFSQLTNLVEETRGRLVLSSQAEAFVYLFLERILGLSEKACRVAVTHGPLDRGIDAVHIDHEGARVVGCEYLGAHVVACDFADSAAQSRLPIPRSRLDRLVNTWVAIASSTDSELTLSPGLRQRIVALHRYWNSVESAEVPHDIYLVTNRERSGIDHREIERQMDYFTRHFYHYYELADLLDIEAHHRAEHSGTNEREEDWEDDHGEHENGVNEDGYGEGEEEEEEG